MPPTDLMPPQLAIVTPPSILDSPRWAWLAEARAAAHEDDIPIFSTFPPGAEPDVWPRLERAEMASLIVVLAAIELAALLGLLAWRWQRNRLRMQ